MSREKECSLTVAPDMTSALFHLTPEQRDDDVIKHALGMRSAWALNNYKRFYSLYASSPKQSSHLIDWFLERERKGHVKLMMKVYVSHFLLAIQLLLVLVLLRSSSGDLYFPHTQLRHLWATQIPRVL